MDYILFIIFFLFVIALVIVAASEPTYTWRDIAKPAEQFEFAWRELEESVYQLRIAVGRKLLPVFKRAADSIMTEFSKSAAHFIDGK